MLCLIVRMYEMELLRFSHYPHAGDLFRENGCPNVVVNHVYVIYSMKINVYAEPKFMLL